MPDRVRQDTEGGVCLMVFSRNTLRPYNSCHCGLDPQTHTVIGFDRMGCRIESGRTQRGVFAWMGILRRSTLRLYNGVRVMGMAGHRA